MRAISPVSREKARRQEIAEGFSRAVKAETGNALKLPVGDETGYFDEPLRPVAEELQRFERLFL